MQLVYPPKHQSFRPLKFELAVMDFYKILFTYSDEMICYDLILMMHMCTRVKDRVKVKFLCVFELYCVELNFYVWN